MKNIKLTKNKFAIVDDDDYEKINSLKWYASVSSHWPDRFYAVRTTVMRDAEGKLIRKVNTKMHRVILGISDGSVLVDHINGDTLDNRKSNLRACSNGQNICNSKLRKDNSSGLRGAYRADNKWSSCIRVDGFRKHLGTFATKEEAHAAYIAAAKKHHGDFFNCRTDATKSQSPQS